MKWKQRLFRIYGAISIIGGLYALYYYGTYLPFVSKLVIAGAHDPFQVFAVCSSFFLGAFALMWVGIRFLTLRNFSRTWLYYAVLPIIPWIQSFVPVERIADMDRLLSLCVSYALWYMLVLGIFVLIHDRWYVPVSHESLWHVGIEDAKTKHPVRYAIIVTLVIAGLIALHPADLETTARMLLSPFVYTWNAI